jgi:hypothetical protein
VKQEVRECTMRLAQVSQYGKSLIVVVFTSCLWI